MASPGKEKKKSQKVVKSCGCGSLCVFNYNIAIELWVMETENSQKLFSVFITHNSKIRELSDENRVIVCQTNFLLWVLPFLSYELWKQRIELSKLAIQMGSKVLINLGLWKADSQRLIDDCSLSYPIYLKTKGFQTWKL